MRPGDMPDFSPAMLALFLRARAFACEEFSAGKAQFAEHMVTVSGLAWSDVRSAFAGKLVDAGKRARLWAALGHIPADYNIVFDDAGGQRHG